MKKQPLWKNRALTLLCAFLLLVSAGCAAPVNKSAAITFKDSTGNTVELGAKPQKVVALTSSLADLWLTAGGSLVGVTDDAKERDFYSGISDVASVGALMQPSAEQIIALNPDILLYSPDIPAHKEIAPTLTEAGISCCAVSVDTFNEYLSMLQTLCMLNGRDDLYQRYGTAQADAIKGLLARVPKGDAKSVLFLRANSSKVKALASEHVVCDILSSINTVNIAASDSGLLENLSLEAIVRDDPEYIFVITMGVDEEKAINSLKSTLSENPAWAGLSAVQNGRFFILPKDLYQYKPNTQWSRAYEYLLQAVYPEVYGEIA